MKRYEDVDLRGRLKAIPYGGGALEIRHTAQEVTFLGVPNQPDYGQVDILIYPRDGVPELKSLRSTSSVGAMWSFPTSGSSTSCTPT